MTNCVHLFLRQILAASLFALVVPTSLQARTRLLEPAWWSNPKTQDHDNWFFPGYGESSTSREAAVQMAQTRALSQILDRLEGVDLDNRSHVMSRIGEWDVDYQDVMHRQRRHHAWVLVRYSKDDLAKLRQYVSGGATRLANASEAFRLGRLDAALRKAESLVSDYPLGAQPIFRTESALLLGADILVAKGKPRQALNWCRQILDVSRHTTSRQEAQTRVDMIDANYRNLLFRGVFDSKTILVFAMSQIDDAAPSPWTRMQRELETVVAQAGGNVADFGSRQFYGVLAADNPQHALSSWLSQQLRQGQIDGFWIAFASGTMNQRPNDANPLGGHDSQFSGETSVRFAMLDQSEFTWERSGLSGWNPMGKEMVMEVLALNIFRAMEHNFSEFLDAP